MHTPKPHHVPDAKKQMKPVLVAVMAFLAVQAAWSAPQVAVDPALVETRYCGPPKRNAKGIIIRRADVVRAYWAQHVCPTTGLYAAPCPDYALNHSIPLACGGCDTVSNMEKCA